MPIRSGIVGIVVGFVARRRGAVTLGSWAIALGALSIIIGRFIAPFFEGNPITVTCRQL
ncbi:hypothetical protein AB9M62_21590 [Bacillales bacterium AN1005]